MVTRNRARLFLLIIAVLIFLTVVSLIYKQYLISILMILILLVIIIVTGKKSAVSYFEKSILSFMNSSGGRVSRSQIEDYFKAKTSKKDSKKIIDTITDTLNTLEKKELIRLELRKDGQEILNVV